MNHVGTHLREDYEYSKKFFSESELYHRDKKTINVDTILRAHYLICDYFESNGKPSFYGVLNPGLIGSAFSRQFTSYEGKKKYSTDLEVCATLFFGIVKNHGFKDGNKRTALLTLLYHLYKINKIPSALQKDFEELTVKAASSTLYDYSFNEKYEGKEDYDVKMIAHFLHKNTTNMTKQYHSITFIELERALTKYGIIFTNPNKNFIDLYYQKPGILGTKIKICNLSCPGLKRQVNRETLNKVLKDINNKVKIEINHVSIYTGTEPMYRLIQDYEGPLQRLKDK